FDQLTHESQGELTRRRRVFASRMPLEDHLRRSRLRALFNNNRRSPVSIRSVASLLAMLTFALLVVRASTAQALTLKECSDKYRAAQSAGTLKGTKWNDFRKAECGPTASAAPTATPAAGAAQPAPKPAGASPATHPSATTGLGSPGGAAFPSAISPKYSTETPGRARMHTCLDQYNANKADNRNGGLQWIQKGGGYYSECNKRLKG